MVFFAVCNIIKWMFQHAVPETTRKGPKLLNEEMIYNLCHHVSKYDVMGVVFEVRKQDKRTKFIPTENLLNHVLHLARTTKKRAVYEAIVNDFIMFDDSWRQAAEERLRYIKRAYGPLKEHFQQGLDSQ